MEANNMAAMRETLVSVKKSIDEMGGNPVLMSLTQVCARLSARIESALATPLRNCDRPECATTKAAQDVWRREDGGKMAYYEWLLAIATEGGNHAD